MGTTTVDDVVRLRMTAALRDSLAQHADAAGDRVLAERARAVPEGAWPAPELLADVAAACGDGHAVLDTMSARLDEMAEADRAELRSWRRRLRLWVAGAASIGDGLAATLAAAARPFQRR